MPKPLHAAALLLLLLPAHAAADATSEELASKIDAVVAPLVEHHVFGGVVLLARGDRVLAERAYGLANVEFEVPVTPETRFAIASITKRFTLLVLRRLADEGKLSFEDKLARWVPGFPSADEITVDQLVTHRSGVRDPEDLRGRTRRNLTTAEVVAHLAQRPLGSALGAEPSYTTANYAILAHVIERVTGDSFAAAVRRYVYDPAGMASSGELTTTAVVPRLASGYALDPFGRGLAVAEHEDTSWKAGGGSSYSTARDLHRFFRALYAGKLSSVPASELFAEVPLFDRPAFRSSGSFPGATAHATYFPEAEVAIVVLSNNSSPLAGVIAESVAAIHFGEPYEFPRTPATATAAHLDPQRLGRYGFEGRSWTLTLEERDGVPVATWTPTRQSSLLRVDANTWFMPLDWALLRFEPDGDGATLTAPWSDRPIPVRRLGGSPSAPEPRATDGK